MESVIFVESFPNLQEDDEVAGSVYPKKGCADHLLEDNAVVNVHLFENSAALSLDSEQPVRFICLFEDWFSIEVLRLRCFLKQHGYKSV